MANPITAIASRSCAKNSMLKQAKEDEKDLSKGSETKSVSTTADVAQDIGGGRGIIGTQTDTTIATPGSEGTSGAKLPSYKEAWEKDLEGIKGKYASYEDYVKDMQGIKPGDTRDVEREAARAEAAKGTPGTPGEEKKESDFEMDQAQVKGQENLDLRADIRQEKILNRLERQAERRQDRFERKGLSGKDKRALRKQQRKDRAASNIQRQQNVQNLIADRRALRDLQRDQGSFGGESYNVGKVIETKEGVVDRVAKESFTPTQVTEMPSGKTKVGSIIEGVGNVFAPKEGGTAVGNTLRDVFGKKEGGTAVGNVLRGIFKEGPAPLKKNYFNK